MITRHIVETSYEYDERGNLTRKTVTTTEEKDSNLYGGWWQYPQPYCMPEITCETALLLDGGTELED